MDMLLDLIVIKIDKFIDLAPKRFDRTAERISYLDVSTDFKQIGWEMTILEESMQEIELDYKQYQKLKKLSQFNKNKPVG